VKQTIAVDIDDVLADYAETFIETSNRLFGTTIDRASYTEDWYSLWNVPDEEVMARREVLFATDMHQVIMPKNGALEVLDRLADRYRLIIITSRHQTVRAATLEWINAHYPVIKEEDVNFSGVWDDGNRNAAQRTKGDIAANLGIDFLIDDQQKHCNAVAERGIKALLFGPQQTLNTIHDKITLVTNWEEVARYFDV
jgi:5'(3')-deoxyribonucleotidase